MKCYYEVLDVQKDADDAEIKSAYRKMALRWHPDKNLDNPDYAKEQFQVVQQAYEVLSDKQERVWYDNHREQILRGANSEFQDNSLDVFQYFTTACFQGYNDEEKGFYTVYRKVFEQIAKEDMDFMEDKEEFCEIPVFGSSSSDYESIVKPFYDYWTSYSTKKSYSWLDPIDIREGKGNRRVMKYIEKENKKVRSKAKSERNEEIRNLVAFVRKRDKRVQTYKKQLEAKTAENRKKQEEFSKQKRIERRKLHENAVEADWAKFDNVQSELKEIEKHLAQQFGEEISNSEDDDEEKEDFNNLYCIACNKVFKNPKAFENHELSKKHRENVEKLKESMLEEEEESHLSEDLDEFQDINEDLNNIDEINGIDSNSDCLGSEESGEEVERRKSKQKKKRNRVLHSHSEEITNENEENGDLEANLDEIDSEVTESDGEAPNISKKNRKKTKKIKNIILNDVESSPELDLNVSDDDFDFGMSKKQKKKNNRKSTANKEKKEENTADNINTENKDNLEAKSNTNNDGISDKTNNKVKPTKKPVKKLKPLKKEITVEELQDIDISHCCVSCKAEFPSKNKLFDHLKKTGHGVYLPSQKGRQSSRKKGAVTRE